MASKETSTKKSHATAVLQALLVTFLWSSSMILIKIGLKAGLSPISFAGLRYGFAFICLLLLVLFTPTHRSALRSIPRATWMNLSLLGILFYTITQGANFMGLSYLPANTLSLIFNFAPLFIALGSTLLTKEHPTGPQWIGVLLSITGALVYFLPLSISIQQSLGYIAGIIGVLANSVSTLLGRHINRQSGLPPIIITTISMGIGGVLLLLVGGTTQGFGQPDPAQWLIIGWLAIVNTAFAFTLWNSTQRTLSAVESGIINNTILPQVAILGWLFLDESLTIKQVIAMLLVAIGVIILQVKRQSRGNQS